MYAFESVVFFTEFIYSITVSLNSLAALSAIGSIDIMIDFSIEFEIKKIIAAPRKANTATATSTIASITLVRSLFIFTISREDMFSPPIIFSRSDPLPDRTVSHIK